jgi:putative addiction module component (TIGR02574 family)
MSSISKKIEQEVLSLPARDRIELIDLLIDSLNLPGDPEIDVLWAEEAERRYSDLETGSITTIPGNKVFSHIKSASFQ